MTEALQVDGVTVTFGTFRAINNLTFHVDYGTVCAIIGPNGAGKTTLLDAITGKSSVSNGCITLDRRIELTKLQEPEIVLAGVGRKFQKPSIFEALTLMQNLMLALNVSKRRTIMELFSLPTAQQVALIEQTFETIGMADQHDQIAGTLSHGQKQWLEIGMLLMQEPRVLLLDEPVAGMSDSETERTADLIAKLKSPDRAIVVIEHDMEFVEKVADRVIVLDGGQLLVEGRMDAVKSDPRVVEVYLGR
ncbi:UNVERIFIED_ORG: urea transport system ATP-binding protein [Agrobacterium larrymoorei]|uniref:Urea ABC transporter ATP-binding protein UrtD n=1 Tax=Agrobacterium cavarae TaxID=2528239 RepID=A0ABY1YDT9_9HYPH|nr:urea ABC transporter ATP-binding protein UrtD [Agrobacterium cavarae]MDP9574003.1 urea transport system ATP-binding protein [Agrobacterium larrymoorei]TBN18470.1 urea ABC transporter ATP-binding protein UrtD [Agrobacterium cavarae]